MPACGLPTGSFISSHWFIHQTHVRCLAKSLPTRCFDKQIKRGQVGSLNPQIHPHKYRVRTAVCVHWAVGVQRQEQGRHRDWFLEEVAYEPLLEGRGIVHLSNSPF